MVHRYQHRLAAVGGEEDNDDDGRGFETYARLRSIATGALQAERRRLIALRDSGEIGDDTLRTIERELDLAETRYQAMQGE